MSDYPTIETSSYMHHPVVFLPAMLMELQGAMRPKPAKHNLPIRQGKGEALRPQILKMRSEGMSQQQIAGATGISKSMVGNILRKRNVES